MTELTEAETERLCSLLATTPPGHLGPWLDTVAAIIDARLAPIRALAEMWKQPSPVSFHFGTNVVREHGHLPIYGPDVARRLRAALDAARAPVSAQHRPNGCCDHHRYVEDGCCHCDVKERADD